MLARFVESDAEAFPYKGKELARLRQRLDDLTNGRDVLVYRHEVPAEMTPPRDGRNTIVFTLRGDRLVDAESERCEVIFGGLNGAAG